MNPFFHRGTFRTRSKPRRNFRPLVEQLESRELLAFDMTVSPSPTVGVTSVIVNGTTLFFATASGANLSFASINDEFNAGRGVIVNSGSDGTEAGNISVFGADRVIFPNPTGKVFGIESGHGIGLV